MGSNAYAGNEVEDTISLGDNKDSTQFLTWMLTTRLRCTPLINLPAYHCLISVSNKFHPEKHTTTSDLFYSMASEPLTLLINQTNELLFQLPITDRAQ
jgi:aminopeptidase-like protein